MTDRLTSAPIAERYKRLVSDPGVAFPYEVQDNVPIDGSNRSLSNYSPFRIRTVLPEHLEDLSFTQNRLSDLSNASVQNPITGEEISLPIREANIFNTANRVYGRSRTSYNARSSAANTLLPGLSERAKEKVGSEIADLELFIQNGRLRTPRNNGYYSEPRFMDQMVAADIAAQALNILVQPPLTLLINPESMNITYNQIFNYDDRGRKGYIYKAWGEQQPKITFSGRIGAFISGSSAGVIRNPEQIDQISGVQFASKRDSASFQNLMALFQMFRNNGYIYDRIDGNFAQQHVGHLAIEYDNWMYLGQMESFGYGYSETTPNGGLNFEVEFIVTSQIDLHQTPFSIQPLQSPSGNPSLLRRGLRDTPNVDLEPDGSSVEPPPNQSIPLNPQNSGSIPSNTGGSDVDIPRSLGGFVV